MAEWSARHGGLYWVADESAAASEDRENAALVVGSASADRAGDDVLGILVDDIKDDLGISDTRFGLLTGPAFALTNATLPFVKSLANLGWREALVRDPHLANGLNVHAGHVNHEAVARDLGYTYVPAADALKA